jgi:hypothetical protein
MRKVGILSHISQVRKLRLGGRRRFASEHTVNKFILSLHSRAQGTRAILIQEQP